MQRSIRTGVSRWKRRLGPVRPLAIDIGLAIVVAVAITVAISVASFPGTRPPDAIAYALGLTIAAFVLVRRRWPVGVLLASFATLQVYSIIGNYPGIAAAVPLAVALYTAAATGHIRWPLGIAVWYLAGRLLFAVLTTPPPPASIFNDIVLDGSLMIAVILFGDAVRSHRALMDEAAERLRRVEEERLREAQELSAARVIQQQLLPKDLPSVPGWQIAAYYQPARAVGGDFYDFLELGNGRVALVAGDVTDKGIPAALVMATTHSILRGFAPGLESPGAVLERANDRLYSDIPAQMFVTCLYAVLDPDSGRLRYANAGHNLPYVATAAGFRELRATGMPLGAMPDTTYEESETVLAPGDNMLLHSDGLVEARNDAGEMFGFPRLQAVVANSNDGVDLIDECLTTLRQFVGRDWEQEDDITLLTLQRARRPSRLQPAMSGRTGQEAGMESCRELTGFALASEPGNERVAMELVATAVNELDLRPAELEKLKTAVAEATMNAMEHGNAYRPEDPVTVRVLASADDLCVLITDQGGGTIPAADVEAPDLWAKLEGRQSPRGWGLFLIQNMVDEMSVTSDDGQHTVKLVLHLRGEEDAGETT
ncbi:MAG: ATP-binding SpoIIE family protein phosphatase [Thermomicrobiales bacterium]